MLLEKLLDVEYYIRSMDIPGLSVFQTQTGQDLRKTGDPLQDIVSLLEEI